MNDYLWDKSGETDEEVRRLEELLGNLRHEPRTLELLRELPATANPPRRARSFFWPALAAAAALLLVALVGLQRNALNGRDSLMNPESASVKTEQTRGAAKATQAEASASIAGETSTQKEKVVEHVAAIAPEGKVLRRATTNRSQAQKRVERRARELDGSGAIGNEQQSARVRKSPRVSPKEAQKDLDSVKDFETVAAVDAREQQLAKEQLMLALRLTSSKLSIVQRKTRGTSDVKPAPEEQQKLR